MKRPSLLAGPGGPEVLETRVLPDSTPLTAAQLEVRHDIEQALTHVHWAATDPRLPALLPAVGSPLTHDAGRPFDERIAQIQASRESITLTPSFTITALRTNTNSLHIAYTDMPADVAVRFDTVTVPLAPGSGSTTLPLSSFSHGDRRVYTTKLVKASTGALLVDNLGGFGIQGGTHTYGGYGYDPSARTDALPTLSHTTLAPLSAAALAEISDLHYIREILGDVTDLATCTTAIEAMQDAIARIENSRETRTMTPSFTVTALRSVTNALQIAVTDMKSGVAVRFGSITVPLPTGSATTSIPLGTLSHGDRRVYTTQLVDATTGQLLVDNLGGFGIAGGHHTYGGYGYDPSARMDAVTALTHTTRTPLTAEQQGQIGSMQQLLARLTVTRDELAERQAALDAAFIEAANTQDGNVDLDSVAASIVEALQQAEAAEGAEAPIEGSLSVLKFDGPTMIFGFSSPSDASLLTVACAGVLSTQRIEHAGGTTFAMGMLTFDITRPAGDYLVRLQNAADDHDVHDLLVVHWDGGHLSLNDSTHTAGRLMPDGSDPLASEAGTALTRLLSLNTAQLSDRNLNYVQQQTLFSATHGLPAPYDFTVASTDVELENKFFDQNPQYKPENWAASIDAEWDRIGRTFERGVAEGNFHNRRLGALNQYRERFAEYCRVMGGLVQQGVDALIRMRKGEHPQTLTNAVSQSINGALQNNAITALNIYGIRIPTRDVLMESARRVLEKEWSRMLQREADVLAYQNWSDAMRQRGLMQTANGDWKAISPEDDDLPPGFTAAQIRQTTAVLTSLLHDPYLVGQYSYQQLVQMAVSTISKSELVAMAGASTDQNNPSVLAAAKTLVRDTGLDTVPVATQQTLQFALNWYDGREMPLPFVIQRDTAISRIFLGLLQQAAQRSSGDFRSMAKIIQSITAIPQAKVLHALNQQASATSRATSLRQLFCDAGYGYVFGAVSQNMHMTSIPAESPSIPLSQRAFMPVHIRNADDGLVEGEDVTVRFDLAMGNANLSHVFVYFTDLNGNSVGSPLTAEVHGLSVTIPKTVMEQRISENQRRKVQFKLAAWFTDSGTAAVGTLSPAFYYTPSSIQTAINQTSVAEQLRQAIDLDSLDDLPATNKAILQYFINTIVAEQNLQVQQANNRFGFILRGNVHGTNLNECKAWLFSLIPQISGKNLPLNISFDSAGNDIVDYEWRAGPDVQEVTKIRGENTFEFMLKENGVVAGDIVQMAYGQIPHTMIVTKIESDGIWVFDTNFGQLGEILESNDQRIADRILENNQYRRITQAERSNGMVATHYWQEDNTVRLHFMKFSDLNSKASQATVYRVNN